MASASIVLAIQPGSTQADDAGMVTRHTEMDENDEPAQRDPAEDPVAGVPTNHTIEIPSSATLVDDADTTPSNEDETETTASYDPRPSTESQSQPKGQFFWDVGEVLPRRKLDCALELLDKTAHSVCTVPNEPVEECMVCLEDMVDGQIVSSLPCSHTFHHECIAAWLRCKLQSGAPGKCPSCNFQIVVPVSLVPAPPASAAPDSSVSLGSAQLYLPGPSPDDPVMCCGFEMRRRHRLLVVCIVFALTVMGTLLLAYVNKH